MKNYDRSVCAITIILYGYMRYIITRLIRLRICHRGLLADNNITFSPPPLVFDLRVFASSLNLYPAPIVTRRQTNRFMDIAICAHTDKALQGHNIYIYYISFKYIILLSVRSLCFTIHFSTSDGQT